MNLSKSAWWGRDVLLAPFVYPAALVMKLVRRAGVERLPLCKQALMQLGIFPLRNHYYEPLFDGRMLRHPLSDPRDLPGIDWNIPGQLDLLAQFDFNDELAAVAEQKPDGSTFSFANSMFGSGDAEFLYNIIRLKKPVRLIEIGSGQSTRLAAAAIAKNKAEDPHYSCMHVCIEPYENPWLEQLGVTVLRQRAEEVGTDFFGVLEENDILFIDSSHVIRPQGDVLFEFLELLPSLKRGVIVHVHDIFTPRDYPSAWILEEVRLWNEQYLLEAFLSSNKDWTVIGALNALHHDHYGALKAKSPMLTPEREPGSFYIQRTA
jgi:hypothetical protein